MKIYKERFPFFLVKNTIFWDEDDKEIFSQEKENAENDLRGR
jgi:hypothetical protein